MKARICLIAGLLAGVAACEQDIEEPTVPLPEAVVYGLVRDEAGEIPPQFSVAFETTTNTSCEGTATASTLASFSGTLGVFRMIVMRVPTAACHRLVVTTPNTNVVADTIRGVQPPFDMPDSLRVDVVLDRRDVQTLRLRAALGPLYGLAAVVLVPDSVDRNQPFTVSSSHRGSTSCTTLDTVEVAQSAGQATLSPYVFERIGGGCTADLR